MVKIASYWVKAIKLVFVWVRLGLLNDLTDIKPLVTLGACKGFLAGMQDLMYL